MVVPKNTFVSQGKTLSFFAGNLQTYSLCIYSPFSYILVINFFFKSLKNNKHSIGVLLSIGNIFKLCITSVVLLHLKLLEELFADSEGFVLHFFFHSFNKFPISSNAIFSNSFEASINFTSFLSLKKSLFSIEGKNFLNEEVGKPTKIKPLSVPFTSL